MKKHEETWTFKKKQKKNIKQWNKKSTVLDIGYN